MASITKRDTPAGRRYDVRWRDRSGKMHSRTFDRERQARGFRDSTATDVRRGDWIDPKRGREPFGSWWARYRSQRVDLRPSTRARDDAYAAAYLLPTFEHMELGDVDHAAIQEWVAQLGKAGLSPATVVKAKQILGRSLRGAVNAGLLRTNPTDEVDVPRIEREEMRFLTPDQVATLAATIDEPYGPLVLVGAYCGLRLGELAGLRRGRVDLLKRTIDVVEIVTEAGGRLHEGPPKTRAGRRTVPMPKVVADALEPMGSMDKDALVFAGERGGALRGSAFRRRVWQPAVRKAGLSPLRPHDLRHTAVAFWITAGAQPLEVAHRAGHTSVVTVLDRYGHLLPRSDDPVTDALDELAAAARAKPAASVRAIGVRSSAAGSRRK